MSTLLFGSCFGVAASTVGNDDDAADGWCMCPSTVSYLLPTTNNTLTNPHDDDDDDDDVTQQQQQQQTKNNAKVSPSPSSPVRVAAHRRSSTNTAAGGEGVLLHQQQSRTVSARHHRRSQEAAAALKQQSMNSRPMSLLQGSSLSKHTGSSPGKTEPSTDDDEEDDDDEEEEDGRGGMQALVNLCVRECQCDEDCVAEPQLLILEEQEDPYMMLEAAFGLQKDSSGIVIELLSAEQAQRQGQQERRRGGANNTLSASAIQQQHQQQQQQGFVSSRRWCNNPMLFPADQPQLLHLQQQENVNFLPTHAEPSEAPLPGRTVCIYRPRRSWPNGQQVRIRWALSRNTSPTTALVLERWTAAVELSPPSSPPSPPCTTSTDLQDQDEFPTRLLNLSETNDTTTARLDGTVEIHDETTTPSMSLLSSPPRDKEEQAGVGVASANHHGDNVSITREIAWLTCYRIVFDEHEDNININNNTDKKDSEHAGTGSSSSSSSPTLIPDPNGTRGYSEKKLAARRLFAQFDEARHGPLRQIMLARKEKEACRQHEQQQQQQAPQDEKHHQETVDARQDSRPCSPATSRSIPPTPSSAARGCDDDLVLNKESSLLLRRLEQQQRESSSSSSSFGNIRSKKSQHQYFVVQDFSVHDDYRGLGLGLCLLDDACRRICDPKAWVLVALPSQQPQCRSETETTSSSSNNNQAKSWHNRKRHFSLGRASWSSMTSSLAFSTRDKKSSIIPDETETLALTEQPQRPNPHDDETLLSYLGLLGFQRLADDSPFCVRWNQSDHLPTIEDICPHVPIFHPPPPPPLQEPQHHHDDHHDGSGVNGSGWGCGDGGDTQHPSSS